MNEELRRRLYSLNEAFQEPVVLALVAVIVGLLALAPVAAILLRRSGRIAEPLYADVMLRWKSWLLIVALLLVPLLLGAAWMMLAVCVLSLLCYREFARATGLFREMSIGIVAVLGILLVAFASFDNFPRLFFASSALTVAGIAIVTIPQDRPRGYIQRTGLGCLGFLLFGYCLGYVGYFANMPGYRSILLLLLLAIELNDVFAYCVGKLVGGPKALPLTSPGKTWSGCMGAVVLTTALVMALGHWVFAGTSVDRIFPLLVLGVGTSVLGQFGDLLLSSIKRDVGIKDLGHVIPGHGGLLDRFDSLVLVPPAAFHFLSLYLGGIGLDQPQRILTGG